MFLNILGTKKFKNHSYEDLQKDQKIILFYVTGLSGRYTELNALKHYKRKVRNIFKHLKC